MTKIEDSLKKLGEAVKSKSIGEPIIREVTLNTILSYLSKLEQQGYRNLVFKLLENGRGSVENYDGKMFIAFDSIKELEKMLEE